MRRLPLAVLTLVAACNSPDFLAWQEEHKNDSMGTDSSGTLETATDDAQPESTGTIGSESAGMSATETAASSDTAPPADTATDSDASDTTDSPPVGGVERPVIVSVDLPADVYAAGPVALAVQAKHTTSVRVLVDDADVGELIVAGEGLFTGELAVRGAIDNGSHKVEVVATQGKYEDRDWTTYDVSTPKAGTAGWSKTGPEGSRTNRIAVTPAGDLIEVGQTLIDGVPQPTIRKRSGVTGEELWPEGTIVLDTREGAVVDVAVLPDGRMWVAMNVREPNKDSRPRMALLDADGHPVGIEAVGTGGGVVRALAVDASGGCFAVGLAGVMGDWDVAYWRVTAEGVMTLDDVYDYVPNPKQDPVHSFRDLATDVVIDGDVAWVVGMSQGTHDDPKKSYLRGLLVPMNLHTAKLAGPATVVLADDTWRHNALFGAALHSEGVVVTGYRCDEDCSKYQIMTSHYSPDGTRTWFAREATNSGLAYGSDIVLDSQGRALVAGAVTQNGKLRGYVFGRNVGEDNGPTLLEHWYPGVGPSESLGIARDSFDRIFPVGYITVNGETQARLTLIHG